MACYPPWDLGGLPGRGRGNSVSRGWLSRLTGPAGTAIIGRIWKKPNEWHCGFVLSEGAFARTHSPYLRNASGPNTDTKLCFSATRRTFACLILRSFTHTTREDSHRRTPFVGATPRMFIRQNSRFISLELRSFSILTVNASDVNGIDIILVRIQTLLLIEFEFGSDSSKPTSKLD